MADRIINLKPKTMKTYSHSFRNIFFTMLSFLVLGIIGCEKDDPGTKTKTPLWVCRTNGDPFHSKPYVSGDKVVFYASNDTVEKGIYIYCINRNTGNRIWKALDTLAYGAVSPVIYNDLIISGGLNPHALHLSNGTHAWMYKDDVIPRSIYNNPLLVGNAVYFASLISVTKHAASSGALVWETEGEHFWTNLRNSSLVFKNGKLYFGDAYLYRMYSFYENSGLIDWFVQVEKPFANIPAVTDNEIFIGIQDADINNKTLRCLQLADQSEKWGVKLGVIFSDVVVAGDKVYAIGMTTVHCRSAIDGSAIWHYELSAGAVSEPLVTGNKVIVGYGNGLICFNATSGEIVWEYETEGGGNGWGFTSPTLDGDRFYVSCADGNVYCFSVD
jgi:outer membrane protein assembly factor BamB